MSTQHTTPQDPPYTIQEIKVIAETPDLRVLEMTLAEGECVPWHYHSNITDTFYCVEGELRIETPKPGETFRLAVGDSLAVPPRRPHEVSNHRTALCRVVLVQGVGSYDYIAVRR